MFPDLRHAFDGELVAQLDDLDDDENAYERSLGCTFWKSTRRCVKAARTGSSPWLSSTRSATNCGRKCSAFDCKPTPWSASGTAMIGLLSRIMSRQKRMTLEKRVTELSRLLARNKELQCRIQNSHHRMAEINELFLRRVSANCMTRRRS